MLFCFCTATTVEPAEPGPQLLTHRLDHNSRLKTQNTASLHATLHTAAYYLRVSPLHISTHRLNRRMWRCCPCCFLFPTQLPRSSRTTDAPPPSEGGGWPRRGVLHRVPASYSLISEHLLLAPPSSITSSLIRHFVPQQSAGAHGDTSPLPFITARSDCTVIG